MLIQVKNKSQDDTDFLLFMVSKDSSTN